MKGKIKIMLALLFMPWGLTAIGLLMEYYIVQNAAIIDQFFESLLKALFI